MQRGRHGRFRHDAAAGALAHFARPAGGGGASPPYGKGNGRDYVFRAPELYLRADVEGALARARKEGGAQPLEKAPRSHRF